MNSVMPHAQYLRIESDAGGVTTSERNFIRHARRRLSKHGRSRESRRWRRRWYLSGLRQLKEQQEMVRAWRF